MEKDKFVEMIKNMPFDFVECYKIVLTDTSNGLEYVFRGERNDAYKFTPDKARIDNTAEKNIEAYKGLE